jgi:hypothetical protein
LLVALLQVVAFLAKLAELRSMTPLHPRITRAMAKLYGLDGASNCEIKCEWLRVSGLGDRGSKRAAGRARLGGRWWPRWVRDCSAAL